MKKRITQKMFATLVVACLFIGGVFAQTHNGTLVPGSGANFANNWADNTTEAHMIEGTTIPMFVMPDGYFHPNYDPTVAVPVRTLTDGFTWGWSVTAGTAANISFGTNNAQDNYTTVTTVANADGAYTIHAVEIAPLAWGSCSGAGEDITLTVHDMPAIALTSDLGAGPFAGCAGAVTMPASVTGTISGGWQNYWLVWNLEIKTLTNLGANDNFYALDKTTTGTPLAVTWTAAGPDKTRAVGANTITSIAGGFTAINNQTTVYTYTLGQISDQALRFSSFIGLNGDDTVTDDQFAYNDFVDQTLVVTVYPTPVTGPIYHINNNWAN
jgi:hypothetical protein